ncbi:MAG: translation initiation factor IF-2 [Nitrososphaerota archaeon]
MTYSSCSRPLRKILIFWGLVDHGKTSLLDKMRGTLVAAREVGGITQHIGASFFPLDAIINVCSKLIEKYNITLKVPGILFIDTPGHAAFTNLRRRGGSMADIAILVIDIINGVQEQTIESIQLLKSRKTPFVVAANKIDLIPDWKPFENETFQETFNKQSKYAKEEFENRIYKMIGDLSFLGFKSDLYTNIKSFKENIAIVPVSAKTGEGIQDLLLVILGLSQTFLKDKLTSIITTSEGSILEIVEEEGLGVTANLILYSGKINVGDRFAFMSKSGPTISKVRALLLPKPLDEMRDPRDKFTQVDSISAVAGVKIVANNLDDAIPGSPLIIIDKPENENEIIDRINKEVESLKINVDRIGVILKADTFGTLESAVYFLKDRGIPVRIADIGDISKRDVFEASIVKQKDEFLGVILAFNVHIPPDIEKEAIDKGVKIFKEKILFRLFENYLNWVEEEKSKKERMKFESLIKPGKIKILEGFVFRRSNPAIFGIEVLAGRIKPKYKLMNLEGKIIGEISQIQDKGQSIPEATIGAKVAISMKEPIVGRHIHEKEILLVAVPEEHARALLKDYAHLLKEDEKEALNELIEIQRKEKILWAR